MSHTSTGVNASEPLVNGNKTDDCCQKIDKQRYVIDGQPISLPVTVNAASMLMQMFIVDAKQVDTIIAGSGYKALTIWPGKAILQLLAVDYRENDLGDYNEGAIIFPVLTPQQKLFPFIGAWLALIKGTACNFVYRMPVNQNFTAHAGRFMWGFPKWNTQMEVSFTGTNATGAFYDNDELVYKIEAPLGGKMSIKEQSSPSVTVRNNRAFKTYGISSAEGTTIKLGGKLPEIGDTHPLAKQLRLLGLPKKPRISISAKHLKMRFGAAEEVAVGNPFTS